jgi:hypothetical protein
MVGMGRLREQEFDARSVEALWKKAVQSAEDAELPGISLDGGLRSAYDAGYLACLALLASHGLRTASGPGHHEMAFAAAAAFGRDVLPDLLPDSEEIRLLRTGSMYDPELADALDLDRALEWVRGTLPLIRRVLLDVFPAIDGTLEEYP